MESERWLCVGGRRQETGCGGDSTSPILLYWEAGSCRKQELGLGWGSSVSLGAHGARDRSASTPLPSPAPSQPLSEWHWETR